MLNSFYELTLIMFKITNVNIHLKFRMFNALLNYLNAINIIIRNNAYTSQAFIL